MSLSKLISSTCWICAAFVVAIGVAQAAEQTLTVRLGGTDAEGCFVDSVAFCPPSTSATKDVSPKVSWSRGPTGTRSYAVLMTDPDVPLDLALINKSDVVIPSGAPRMTVYHWVLADIPATVTALPRGAESEGLVPGGKPVGQTPYGLRGANVFTTFLSNVAGMSGTYGGYDGPCPPANDERPHHYVVRVLALNVPTLGLSGPFTGSDVERAAVDHVLAVGQAVGSYSLGSKRKE